MRIVSYNINLCNQSKIDHVLSTGADLYILPECAGRDYIGLPEGYDMLWTGDADVPQKGLAVIWKTHLKVRVPEEYRKIKHMLPLCVDGDGFPKFILASWPTVWKEKKTYPQLLLEALKQYDFYLDRFPSIVVGDFNCYLGQSGVNKSTGTFSDCLKEFEKHGMRSMYHEMTCEAFSKETTPTFYWRFKEESPFHIDYAFSCIEPKRFEIGPWEREISDHRPLIIELETEPYDGRP